MLELFSPRASLNFLFKALLIVAILPFTERSAKAQSLPCRGDVAGFGRTTLLTTDLNGCASLIRAGASGATWGTGAWGNYPVKVDINGNVFVGVNNTWRYAGVYRNPGTGTVGSLADQCFRGNVNACNQWYIQSDRAIQQMERMYGPNWLR